MNGLIPLVEFLDRISQNPGRIELTDPDTGESRIFDLKRADDPTEPGTPINRALFNWVASVYGVPANVVAYILTPNILTPAERTEIEQDPDLIAIVNASRVFNLNAANITSGTLLPARGGTGQASLQATRNAMGLGNTLGAVPVANGGTGLAASPSMVTNLASTAAANVLQASPRPGVTGVLGIGNGGTSATNRGGAVANLFNPQVTNAGWFMGLGTGGWNNEGHISAANARISMSAPLTPIGQVVIIESAWNHVHIPGAMWGGTWFWYIVANRGFAGNSNPTHVSAGTGGGEAIILLEEWMSLEIRLAINLGTNAWFSGFAWRVQ